jgi:hypothetical protein
MTHQIVEPEPHSKPRFGDGWEHIPHWLRIVLSAVAIGAVILVLYLTRRLVHVMGSVAFQPLQLGDVRARLRKMRDADLLRYGRAAARLCRPEAQFGHRPRQVVVDQLKEA